MILGIKRLFYRVVAALLGSHVCTPIVESRIKCSKLSSTCPQRTFAWQVFSKYKRKHSIAGIMSEFETLRVEIDGYVATVTLCNGKGNAMSAKFFREIKQVCARRQFDRAVGYIFEKKLLMIYK